jgi:hypothetical protein
MRVYHGPEKIKDEKSPDPETIGELFSRMIESAPSEAEKMRIANERLILRRIDLHFAAMPRREA